MEAFYTEDFRYLRDSSIFEISEIPPGQWNLLPDTPFDLSDWFCFGCIQTLKKNKKHIVVIWVRHIFFKHDSLQ